jgi:hypothetical protein
MRFRMIPVASLMPCLLLACLPGTDARAVSLPNLAAERDTRTISGTISSIGDASFTVDVKQDQGTRAMEFLIDDATRFDGRLEMGAQATVQFRSNDGNNIAVYVAVKTPRTMGIP